MITATRRMKPLLALLLLACRTGEEPPPPTAEKEEAEPSVEAAEPSRAPEAEEPLRSAPTASEREAIAQARARRGRRADGEAEGPGSQAELTDEERIAAADDPAARLGSLDGPDAETPPPEAPGEETDAPPRSADDDSPGEPTPASPSDDPAEYGSNAADPTAREEVRPGALLWPATGEIRLIDLAVATGVKERTPQGVAETFEDVPTLFYCYTAFDNPDERVTVTHVWRRDDRIVSRVELEVGVSARWRTWSRQRAKPSWSGIWSCEVLGPDGQRLGRATVRAGE